MKRFHLSTLVLLTIIFGLVMLNVSNTVLIPKQKDEIRRLENENEFLRSQFKSSYTKDDNIHIRTLEDIRGFSEMKNTHIGKVEADLFQESWIVALPELPYHLTGEVSDPGRLTIQTIEMDLPNAGEHLLRIQLKQGAKDYELCISDNASISNFDIELLPTLSKIKHSSIRTEGNIGFQTHNPRHRVDLFDGEFVRGDGKKVVLKIAIERKKADAKQGE